MTRLADAGTPPARAPGPAFDNGWINMLLRQRDPPRFYERLARRHGDVVRFRFGPTESWLISHPDLVRDVFVTNQRKFGRPVGAKILRKMMLGEGLLTSEGEFHMRQRRMMQPAFHRQRVAGYAQTMAAYAGRWAEAWAAHPPDQPLPVAEEMMRLTLAIVAKTLFDADVDGDASDVGGALDTMFHSFDRNTSPLHILKTKLGLASSDDFWAARRVLDDIIYRIIRERRALGEEDRGDLLSMLLSAADEPAEGAAGGQAPVRMTDEQVRDEAMTLFLAGHETTALALSWAWHLLSQHPEVEARLHAEVDQVLGGRLPTFEDFARLPWTEAVVAETLRLYPPAWLLGRSVVEPHEVAGHRLKPREAVVVSPFVMHRDPRFFADPERFDPGRWTPAFKASLPRLAYLPFGGGNRVCIGEGFAWAEAVLVLATLAQRWRLAALPGQAVQWQAFITLRPRGGLPMRLLPRQR